MGYSTDFEGKISIEPALSVEEIKYLNAFFETRHMKRHNGPYVIDVDESNNSDVIDSNSPPKEQPGLWCDLEVSADGTELYWNGAEKTYYLGQWVAYVIEHFIKPDCIAKQRHPDEYQFFTGHTCNGILEAQGESHGDIWGIIVQNNIVSINEMDITPSNNAKVLNPSHEMLTQE